MEAEKEEFLGTERSTSALLQNNVTQVVDPEAAVPEVKEKKIRDRDAWTGKFDFLLACCGSAVGLGNVWRFPYLCYRNGGGAFLIPYLIVVLISGIPVFLLEVALGQQTKLGAIQSWSAICPLLSGIGIASAVIVFFTLCYYAIILAWALFYLLQSFRATLPWSTCDNPWNNITTCRESFVNISEEDRKNYTSPVLEYWEGNVLKITDGIHDLGTMRWELVGYLLLVWIICYFTVFKGTKSTGKAMYFTATFPYVMLIILLVRGVTLDGASLGIKFYLQPNMTKLMEPQVWIDAGTQVFFSYSLCIGVLVSLGSFNSYNNNCLKDTVIIACVNSGTSFLAGFAIFSALGFMAKEQGMSVADVAEKGPGLAFIAYPKEVLLLPAPQLWSCLFFIMIFLLGISTLLTDTLALMTSMGDLYPSMFRGGKYRKAGFIAVGCFILYLIGLTMVTEGGMYILQLFDFYGASGFTLLWTATWQCIGVAWVYGDEKFYDSLEAMVGYRPGHYYRICWKYLAPILNMAIFLFSIVKYEPLKYNKKYEYPYWGHMIGWTLALSSIVCIPIRMIVVIRRSEGNTFMEKLNNARKPACIPAPSKKLECQLADNASQESPPPPYSSKTNFETSM